MQEAPIYFQSISVPVDSATLGQQLLALYGTTAFGNVPKRQIDLMVFSFLARQIVQGARAQVAFRWHKLTPADLRQISIRLRIPESRVASLVEQAALNEDAANLTAEAALDEIAALASGFRQDKKDLDEGRIGLFVPNQVVRKAIEAFLIAGGEYREKSAQTAARQPCGANTGQARPR